MSININELTVGQAKELAAMFKNTNCTETDSGPWEIGKIYFIRMVTMHVIGRLKYVGTNELVLTEAAWVAEACRFNAFLKDPTKAQEVEPFINPVIVGRAAIIDATEVPCTITEVK